MPTCLAAVHEKTPTAAAKFLINRACDFQQRLEQLAAKIREAAQGTVRAWQHQLSRYGTLIQVQAVHRLKMQQRELERMLPLIIEAATRSLKQGNDRLTNINEKIHNLSPQRTLERGFAIIRKGPQIVTEGTALSSGDAIQVIFAQSEAEATITQIQDGRTDL